jgi:uncharacterized protein (TIGR02466 family)
MELNNTQIENYFQSPIWIEDKKEFLKDSIKNTEKHIKEAKLNFKEIDKKNNNFGFSYHSGPIQFDPNFKQLVDYIGNRSKDFLEWQGYDLKNHMLIFTEMWVQEFAKKGGGHHDTHVHYNNHVSGFYFLKCSEKTSYPIFHDPRPGSVMTKLPLKDQRQISYGLEAVNFKVNPGTMILFNSYVPHQFALDHGKEPFRFIHWNIQAIPDGKFRNQ